MNLPLAGASLERVPRPTNPQPRLRDEYLKLQRKGTQRAARGVGI